MNYINMTYCGLWHTLFNPEISMPFSVPDIARIVVYRRVNLG